MTKGSKQIGLLPPGERLGRNLRDARVRLGYTQAELAERLGFTQKSLSDWETARYTPNLDNACVLAEAIGLTLDGLVGFAPRGKPLPTCSTAGKRRRPNV